MCIYLKAETDIAQNMIDYFFLTLTVRSPFHGETFKWRGYGSAGLRSKETEGLHAKLNERAEAATSVYSAAAYFL